MPRGHYGKLARRDAPGQLAFAKVGGEWFHSGADRTLALGQISKGFATLYAEILNGAMNIDPARARAFGQWIEADVAPTLAAWSAFEERERTSWWVRAATSWQTFTTWRERLKNLRQLARAHGVEIQSPEPPPLPMTVWEQSEGGVGTAVVPWLGLAKLAVGGAIAVTGAITVYTVVRDYADLRRTQKSR